MTFMDICKRLNDLYEAKNADYGNAYARLREDYPMSICWRLTDKLYRLETLFLNGKAVVKDESLDDTLMDIACYAILELLERANDED